MEAYGPLRDLHPSLSVIDGEWQESPFKRRMTVMRLSSGEQLIHNPFQMRAEDLERLQARGPIAALIAPNTLHASEIHWLALALPQARVFVPAKMVKQFRKKLPSRAVHAAVQAIETEWPAQWDSEVACIPIHGTRMNESVFIHRASSTLVVTDLVFHLKAAFQGLMGTFMRWNRIGDGLFGPSRLFQYVFTSDRRKVALSMEQVLKESFEKVVMNHGEVLMEGGKDRMKRAFSYLE